MDTLTVDSRIKGSIFGVAVVDALGGPVEFQPRGTFDPVTDFRHNEHFDVPPGTWTDDTSMTLCLAKSLIDSKGEFISQAAIRNYIDWWEDGYLSATGDCFDIGAGTTKALMTWQAYFDRSPHIQKDDPHGHEGGQPAIDRALKREEFCGNGSLMRVSPIALVYFRNMPEAIANAAASSDVTHPYPTCAEACTIYTGLLVHALNNTSKTNLAADLSTTAWKDPSLKGRLGGYRTLSDWAAQDEDSIKSSGFVVSTLEAALWAFFTTDSFEAGALRAVNLGWDADTVGAVYGGLAGAFYGFEAIPRRWVSGLQRGEIVAGIAEGLVALSHVEEIVRSAVF